MNFHITNIEPKYDVTGRVKIVRFGLSFFEDGCENDPHSLLSGYLLVPPCKVNPPKTFQQRGAPTNVVMHSEDFLADLEKLWRTHPELKGYSEMVSPDVTEADRLPLKERVTVSIRGLYDGV